MVGPRFSICQEPAAPLQMTSSTAWPSRPAFRAKASAFGEALDQAGDADLVDHLGELAGAGRAHQPAGAGIGGDHRLGAGVGRRRRRRTSR